MAHIEPIVKWRNKKEKKIKKIKKIVEMTFDMWHAEESGGKLPPFWSIRVGEPKREKEKRKRKRRKMKKEKRKLKLKRMGRSKQKEFG